MSPTVGEETTDSTVPAEQGDWLRVADAARVLGVSPNTLRRAGSFGGLRCHRSPGGHRRYRRADLEAFLVARSSASPDESARAPVRDGSADRAGSEAAIIEDLERRVCDLTAQVGMCMAVSAALEKGREDALRIVASCLCDFTGAPVCAISVVEGEELIGAVSYVDGVWDTAWEGLRIPQSDVPVLSLPVTTGRPSIVRWQGDDDLDPRLRESLRSRGYEVSLAFPMMVRDEVIGVVELLDHRPHDFERNVGVVTSLAQTAAHALDNARLVERLERQNAALRELVEIGKLSTDSADLSEAVRVLARRLMHTMDVDSCEIYAIDHGSLRLIAGYDTNGFADAWNAWSAPLTEFPTTAAGVDSAEVVVVEDLDDPRLTDHERERMRDYGLRSEICVPLVVEDKVVGIIDVFDTRPRRYEEHVDFLRSVAPVVARALENALLVDRLRETTDELGQLVDAGFEFGASLDLQEVLSSTAKRMAAAAGTTGCDLYRLDDGVVHNLISVKGGEVNTPFIGSSFPVSDYYYWEKALADRTPVFAADIFNDPDAYEGDRRAATEWGYRAALDLPLVVQGRVIGLAELFSAEPFTSHRIELLQGLAQFAAQAIANASVYAELDRSARRLELVADQSLRLSATLELDAVIAATARSLRESGGFTDCDVFMVEGDELVCAASLVEGDEYPEWIGKRLPLNEWRTVRQAVETGMTVVIESLDDPRLAAEELEVRREYGELSVLIVPLVAKDRVVAVVELIDKGRPRHYDAEQIATAEALSRVAGLALDNAELYSDIKTMHLSNLKALSSALNAKDYYTLGHAARVAAYMVLLGKELGWGTDLIRHVEEAAYLHDIGKIGVSDRVLLKPGGLNAHEWELMRQHPVFSADIIRPLFEEPYVLGVRHHHERFGGGGYPDGIAGEDIPEVARMMCVADSYDAMSFRRPYRQALDYEECVAELRRCSGSQFDPEIVEAFVRVLGRLRVRKVEAMAVAEAAAVRIDAARHLTLDSRKRESSPAYREIMETLREVRNAHPPTRYLGTRARFEGGFVIVADVGGGTETASHIGDEVFADDELPEAFAGVALDTVVLYVDEFGVWVSGLAPVRVADGTVVAVVAADMPPPGADESEMEGLRSDVTQTFSSMLRSAAARLGRAEIEAITDGISGLYNHRYLHERLEEEVDRARSEGRPLSLLVCDIDRFKEYNEEHGHSAGDEALRVVARVIETSVRHVDLAARYGGGEFAVILVDTDVDGALDVAERLRAGVAAAKAGQQVGPLRVSVGAATFPQDAGTKAELLDKADWAMYLAKRQGRDRVLGFRGRKAEQPS